MRTPCTSKRRTEEQTGKGKKPHQTHKSNTPQQYTLERHTANAIHHNNDNMKKQGVYAIEEE